MFTITARGNYRIILVNHVVAFTEPKPKSEEMNRQAITWRVTKKVGKQ